MKNKNLSENQVSLIRENILKIRKNIKEALKTADRSEDRLKILAASKTRTAEEILSAMTQGITLFGENRVQEAAVKVPEVNKETPYFTFHFIGHLQKNKIKTLLPFTDCIQSIDRVSLAEKLSALMKERGRDMDIFIQVNTSGEKSKSGFSPGDASDKAGLIAGMAGLKLKGFMTIASFTSDEKALRREFQTLRRIRDEILKKSENENLPDLKEARELSMGMSHDYRIAIEEGATIIRPGRAIFGERS